MATRGGLWINITGGVDPNTIKSMRLFARSLSQVSYAARGLEKVNPGSALESSVGRIKKFHNSVLNSINGIISGVERYKRSAQNLRISLKSDSSKFKVLGNAISGTITQSDSLTRSIKRLHPALQKASLSLSAYNKNMQKLNRGFVGYKDSAGQIVSNTNQIAGSTKRAKNEMGLFGRTLDYVTNRTRQFAGFVVAATMIQGFTQAISNSIRVMSQYDQSLQNLQAILNITASQSKILGDEIQDVSRRTKFSAQEVSEGMQTLGQAGLSMNESLSSIAGVARLATGTMSDFQTVSDLVTTTLNAFNLAATESTRIADVFANAINNSKLSVDKLGTAFNYVGAAGKQVGLSLNEVSGTLMTLADNGLRASTMGTGLRRMMLKMVDASSDLEAALSASGKNVDELNPKIVGWEQSLQNLVPLLWDARRETVDMGKAAEYFGTRAAQVAAVLVRNAANGSKALQEAIGNTREFGSAARMADTQIEGLQLSFKNLQDRIKLIAVALGEAGLTSALQFLVDTLSVAASAVERFINVFGSHGLGAGAIGVLSLFSIALSKVLVWLKNLALGTSTVIGSMRAYQTAVGHSLVATNALSAGITRTSTTLSALNASVTSSVGALSALRGSLGMMLTSWNAVSVIIAGATYALYKFVNAHSDSAKELSKQAQEFAAAGKSIQEWGKSLKDAFATQQWEDTVKRFEEVEVAGRNLKDMLETELEDSLENVASEGVEGFEKIDEAIKNVSMMQFTKQSETAAEQLNEVINSAGRMQALVGMSLPKDLQKSQKEMGLLGKSVRWLAGGFHDFNTIVGLGPIEQFLLWSTKSFGPDKQEMLDNYKDGIYNLTGALKNMSEAQDMSLAETAKQAEKAIIALKESIDGDAGPAIERFANDMMIDWGSKVVGDFERVQSKAGKLFQQLRSGEVSIKDFKKAYSELSMSPFVSDAELNNITEVKEAQEVLTHTIGDLEEKKKDLENQVKQLFKGEKELGDIIWYVNHEMELSDEMTKRVISSLKNLTATVDNTVMSYDVFLGKIKNIDPSALNIFEGLSDAHKAQLKASYEEVENAGDELRKLYESNLPGEMDLEDALGDGLTDKEVEEYFAPFTDVSGPEEALEKIRKAKLDSFKKLVADLYDETDDIYDQQLEKISNKEKEMLLEVESGSVEALRIREKYAKKELEVARQRYEEEKTAENYGKLLDAKKEYLDSSADIEEKITENVIEESEKRIEAKEQALQREEALLNRDVVRGEATEEDVELRLAKRKVQIEKDKIKEKENLISKLQEEGESEEKVKEIIDEKRDVETDLIKAQNQEAEARINQIDAQIDRERELVDLKHDSALAGIEDEKERYKIIESNRSKVLGTIEREAKFTYEASKRKLAAEQEYQQRKMDLFERQLSEYENEYGEQKAKELQKYKEVELRKQMFFRQSQREILDIQRQASEARIRAEGSMWEKTQLGLRKFSKDYADSSKDWVDATKDFASEFASSTSNALSDFIMNTKSADQAFKSFANSVLETMSDMLAEAVTKQFIGLLLNVGGSMLGGGLSSSTPQNPGSNPDVLPHVMHSGGVVGEETNRRVVSSAIFDKAKKMHDGLKGLTNDEYPAILKKGEVVFTEGQMSALGNSMQQGSQQAPNFEVNVINNTSEKAEASKSEPKWDGEKFVMNVILDAANRNRNNFGKNLKGSLSKV